MWRSDGEVSTWVISTLSSENMGPDMDKAMGLQNWHTCNVKNKFLLMAKRRGSSYQDKMYAY